MNLSVIVCSWSNPDRLTLSLGAMSACRIPAGVEWELVLVNSGAGEATSAVARRYAGRLPIRHVEQARPGLSRAKNAGLRAAIGSLLVFADDDVQPGREWLAAYWAASQERSAGYYFGGPIMPEYEGGPPSEELLRVAGGAIRGVDWGPEARLLSDGERFYPANWACPAAAIHAAGEFDVRLGLDASLGQRRVGETFDMMDRLAALGLSPWYVPGARVRHFVPRAKCTIEFLGENAEAIGHYSVRATRPHPLLVRRPHLRTYCERQRDSNRGTDGVPWTLYIRAALLGGRWIGARALGRRAYPEYVDLRFCIGLIRGHRELRAT